MIDDFEETRRFTAVGAMYSSMVAIDDQGHLHQWLWDSDTATYDQVLISLFSARDVLSLKSNQKENELSKFLSFLDNETVTYDQVAHTEVDIQKVQVVFSKLIIVLWPGMVFTLFKF